MPEFARLGVLQKARPERVGWEMDDALTRELRACYTKVWPRNPPSSADVLDKKLFLSDDLNWTKLVLSKIETVLPKGLQTALANKTEGVQREQIVATGQVRHRLYSRQRNFCWSQLLVTAYHKLWLCGRY